MVALLARISTYNEAQDGRSSARRLLRLNVPASASGDAAEALVHNLSERGLLLESAIPLEPGDVLVVELPRAGAIAAEVIWARDGFAGCHFERPISKAAVSASLLRSAPEAPPYVISPTQPRLVESDWQYEPAAPMKDGRWLRTLTLVSLLLASVVAAIFIMTLFAFPFAAS